MASRILVEISGPEDFLLAGEVIPPGISFTQGPTPRAGAGADEGDQDINLFVFSFLCNKTCVDSLRNREVLELKDLVVKILGKIASKVMLEKTLRVSQAKLTPQGEGILVLRGTCDKMSFQGLVTSGPCAKLGL